MSTSVFIGVDPGLSGALAFISDQDYCVYDLPIATDGTHKWVDGIAFARKFEFLRGTRAVAYVERTHAMPKQGVSSTFSSGMALGSVLAALQGLEIPIRMVAPATWKKASKLSSDKNASLGKARLMFPNAELHRKKDHNRAEALLIADWGRQHG